MTGWEWAHAHSDLVGFLGCSGVIGLVLVTLFVCEAVGAFAKKGKS